MGIYEFIGERIRALRDEQRLSQDALAKAIGVSTNTISRWETATYKPSVDDLQKLANYFKVRLSSLLPPEDKPNEPLQTLMSKAGDLHKDDVDALIDFAEWRRTRRRLDEEKKKR